MIGRWVGVLAGTLFLWGAEAVRADEVQEGLKRGVAFLVQDARQWRTQKQCASCHHASMTVWGLHEARRAGVAVDPEFLAEWTKWLLETGDGATSVPRPESAPKALNTKPVWYALALAADTSTSEATTQGLGRLLETVRKDQLESGGWSAWPETRPPMFGNSDVMWTALATWALFGTGASNEVKAARDRGVQALAGADLGDELQTTAVKLAVWVRARRPVEERAALVQRMLSLQRDDGGWSQIPAMESDAWGTGQTLYVLNLAGVAPMETAMKKGVDFLIRTQREDGSWPMVSRPTQPQKPEGMGAKNLVPIVGAGSAWGVIGLARSVGAVEAAKRPER